MIPDMFHTMFSLGSSKRKDVRSIAKTTSACHGLMSNRNKFDSTYSSPFERI